MPGVLLILGATSVKRKKLRIFGYGALGFLTVLAIALAYVWRAIQHVPDFYENATRRDKEAEHVSSEQFLQDTTNLYSDVGRPGDWQAVITADEINGWLADDFAKNFPKALPSTIHDPRVELKPGQGTFACRYDKGGIHTVYSLSFDVALSGPNLVAIRIRGAHVGSLPAPLDYLLEAIRNAAKDSDLDLEWRQAEGDPVAVFHVAPTEDEGKRAVTIEAFELREGELFVAGRTQEREATPAAKKDE